MSCDTARQTLTLSASTAVQPAGWGYRPALGGRGAGLEKDADMPFFCLLTSAFCFYIRKPGKHIHGEDYMALHYMVVHSLWQKGNTKGSVCQ